MSAENWALANLPTADYFLLSKLQRQIDDSSYAVRLKLKAMKACCRLPLSADGRVHVLYEEAADVKRAHFTNLAHCNSLWACPVCTPYRLRKYAEKITALIRRRTLMDETAYMLTLTIPHRREQSAAEVIGRLTELKRATIGKGSWYGWKKVFGVTGHVQSNECTYSGLRGWHFHTHMLVFLKNGSDIEQRIIELTARLQKSWVAHYKWDLPAHCDLEFWNNKSVYLSMDKSGRPRAIKSGDYICGYGAMEIAKTSNNSHSSANVFDLLASDDPRDNALFMEYALATRGLHRVNMSPGMAKSIQPEDYKTEEVQERITAQKKRRSVIASFTLSQWRAFCDRERSTGVDLRAELLATVIVEPSLGAIRRWAEFRGLPADFVGEPAVRILQYEEQFEHEQAGYYV